MEKTQSNNNINTKPEQNQDSLLNGSTGAENSTQEKEPQEVDLNLDNFEQDVILRQSPVWSRAMIWSIMGVTVFAVGWAYFAKIEQVVASRGQLKPKATVKEIQAPINGVVKRVEVEDGQKVKEGDPLLIFDSDATEAQLDSLQQIRSSLVQENKFYRTLMNTDLTPEMVEQVIFDLNLPIEVQALALNRTSLVEENKLFQAQLNRGITNIASLSSGQLARLQAANAELDSRVQTADLEVQQLEKQLRQNEVQLADARQQLIEDEIVLAEINNRNEQAITQARESLRIEEGILESIKPLSEEGALAKVQIDRQLQEVRDRRVQLVDRESNGKIDYQNQKQQIQARTAEIERLEEEQNRIRLDIQQAEEQLKNTFAITEKDVRDRVAENEKRIAELDTQINKIIIDNEKRISETNSQISSAQQTIKYQEINAPVSGTVFDLQAGPGFVPKSGQAEPLLKIVPDASEDNPLIAEVYVTNQDIGFVRKNQDVDVRIDSFPYSEFGDIKGKVYFVGSDALPPNEIYNFHRFPVKVELDQQKLMIRDEGVDLQSGMSVSVNIKVKENRTVLSLFTELFNRKVESFKQVR